MYTLYHKKLPDSFHITGLFPHRNYILMQNKALDELRRLVAYLCQAAGIALPNIAAMVGGAEQQLQV